MTKCLNDTDRNILEFRPNIDFVEPDLEPQAPNPIEQVPETPQVEDARAFREQVKRLAQAVNVLATAVQARADQRAANMVIKLDPIMDAETIHAMRRQFPEEDATQITYQQYRACKDFIRNTGEAIGRKASITPDEVKNVRDEASQAKSAASGGSIPGGTIGSQLGGFNTEQARTGGLRPELDQRTRILDPIDIDDFQINMICILVNFIWKSFILPIFNAAKIPVVGVSLGSLLPKRLCNPGVNVDIPGLAILGISGFKKPQQPKIPEEGPEI